MDKDIVKAVAWKVATAKGEEHKLFESMALWTSGSFDFGIAAAMYVLSSVLGEDVVKSAMQLWLTK